MDVYVIAPRMITISFKSRLRTGTISKSSSHDIRMNLQFMAWELANEPRGKGSKYRQNFWIMYSCHRDACANDISAYIKYIDSNRLVTMETKSLVSHSKRPNLKLSLPGWPPVAKTYMRIWLLAPSTLRVSVYGAAIFF